MTTSKNQPMLHVPARDIPVPPNLSPEAQAFVAMGVSGALPSLPKFPSVEDTDGWLKARAEMDGMNVQFLEPLAEKEATFIEEIDADGVPVYVAIPRKMTAPEDAVFLDFHGGAWVWCGGPVCRALGMMTAGMIGARVWAVDNRMAPDVRYPVPLDDCVTAYRALLRYYPPEKVIVGGASAGGNLAAATVLRARDEGLPLPAAVCLQTPALDLTESGDTFQTLRGIDTAITESLKPIALLYAGGHDLRDPYLSPIFGDFSKGYPPSFLQSGTRDLLLSTTVQMHRALRAADIPAELHVWDAATHVMFVGAPEAEELNRELRRFCNEYWNRSV